MQRHRRRAGREKRVDRGRERERGRWHSRTFLGTLAGGPIRASPRDPQAKGMFNCIDQCMPDLDDAEARARRDERRGAEERSGEEEGEGRARGAAAAERRGGRVGKEGQQRVGLSVRP